MSARKVTGFILAVTTIFLFFRLVEWQFGERAHVYTLVAVWLLMFAVIAWLNRR